MLENIVAGLGLLFTLKSFISMNIGLLVGIAFGALPGLTATMGVALFLPLTFGMDSVSGIILLLGIYCGGIYGGSITAILIKTPGTPASAATVLDGYVMAQNGRSGIAMKMALVASTIAGIFSALMLLFIAPQLARLALKFGPAEYFSLAVFGLTIIATVSSKNLIKGIIMGILGMFVSIIGLDPIGGIPRMNYGIDYLAGGINLIPALVGLFAISEILTKIRNEELGGIEQSEFQKEPLGFFTVLRHLKTILKSSLIGTIIGGIPGTGPAISSFLSYNEAKRVSKTPEKFGTGHLDGVAAAEAGNNGVTGATLIPLLTLGVPGDTTAAVLLGAFMMHGLVPGPQLFKNYAPIVYAIMLSLIFINIFMYFQASVFIKGFVKITRIPNNLLLPVLIILCIVGSYAVNNTMFDVKVMLIFGLLGYILPRFGFPVTPMLLAIILGPLAETSLRQALILSDGSFSILISRPISFIFILMSVLSLFYPYLSRFVRRLVPSKT